MDEIEQNEWRDILYLLLLAGASESDYAGGFVDRMEQKYGVPFSELIACSEVEPVKGNASGHIARFPERSKVR